jgi:hypothetical protein
MSKKRNQRSGPSPLVQQALQALQTCVEDLTTKLVDAGHKPDAAQIAVTEAVAITLAALHCQLKGLDSGAVKDCYEALGTAAQTFAEQHLADALGHYTDPNHPDFDPDFTDRLADALGHYTDLNHPDFDPDFNEKIRKLRPDWFGDDSQLN